MISTVTETRQGFILHLVGGGLLCRNIHQPLQMNLALVCLGARPISTLSATILTSTARRYQRTWAGMVIRISPTTWSGNLH